MTPGDAGRARAGARDQEIARLRRSLPAVWRPVAAEAFRRSLGRAVSVL